MNAPGHGLDDRVFTNRQEGPAASSGIALATFQADTATMTFDPEYATLFQARPKWVKGSIQYREGLFLRESILEEKPSIVLEIGTGSGFSSASLCHSLEVAARLGGASRDYRVISYDSSGVFYADHSKSVGDAARELLDPDLVAHIEFRHPRSAADAAGDFPKDSIPLAFIHANHNHPWPTLDLLALTRIMWPGGTVFLHDINLPFWTPDYQCWGPHHLFTGLKLEKQVSTEPTGLANLGRLRIPMNKASLRRQLIGLLNAHPWEEAVDEKYLARLRLGRYRDGWREDSMPRRMVRLFLGQSRVATSTSRATRWPDQPRDGGEREVVEGQQDDRQFYPQRNSPLPEWRTAVVPDEVNRVRAMLMPIERQLLYGLARDYFSNEGVMVDAGCFLGGSTLSLASGLRANERFRAAPRRNVIHAYDLFTVKPWMIGDYFPLDTPPATSFEPMFRENIASFADLVAVHAGDVTTAPVPQPPIEILFIDLAKHWTLSDHIVRAFFPRLIPGRSVVIQQDYLYHAWSGWLPVTMEHFSEYFELVDHTPQNSAVFFYKRQAPPEAFARDVIQTLSTAEMRALSDRAIARFGPPQQVILRQSWKHFQELLGQTSPPPDEPTVKNS